MTQHALEQIVGPEPRAASFASSLVRRSCSLAPWPGQLRRSTSFSMAAKPAIQRKDVFGRYAPVLLVVSLIWVLLTLRHQPISFGYIFGWTLVGLLFSAVTIFGARKRSSWILELAPVVVLIGGGDIISHWVTRAPSGWIGSSQGIAIVFVCFCALNWTVRPKPTVA